MPIKKNIKETKTIQIKDVKKVWVIDSILEKLKTNIFKDEKSLKKTFIFMLILWILIQTVSICFHEWWINNLELLQYFSYTNSINDFVIFISLWLIIYILWLLFSYFMIVFFWFISLLNKNIWFKIISIILTLFLYSSFFYSVFINNIYSMSLWSMFMFLSIHIIYCSVFISYFNLKVWKDFLYNLLITFILIIFLLLTFPYIWISTIWCLEVNPIKNSTSCYEIYYKNDKYAFTTSNKVLKIDEFKSFYTKSEYISQFKYLFKKGYHQ